MGVWGSAGRGAAGGGPGCPYLAGPLHGSAHPPAACQRSARRHHALLCGVQERRDGIRSKVGGRSGGGGGGSVPCPADGNQCWEMAQLRLLPAGRWHRGPIPPTPMHQGHPAGGVRSPRCVYGGSIPYGVSMGGSGLHAAVGGGGQVPYGPTHTAQVPYRPTHGAGPMWTHTQGSGPLGSTHISQVLSGRTLQGGIPNCPTYPSARPYKPREPHLWVRAGFLWTRAQYGRSTAGVKAPMEPHTWVVSLWSRAHQRGPIWPHIIGSPL